MTGFDNSTALLMLDYQVALCDVGPLGRVPALAEQVKERGVLANASRVLAKARDEEALIVHVRLAFDPTYRLRTNRLARFDAYPQNQAMLRDSPEAAIVEELAPAPGEPVLDKGCVGPFVGTPLETALRAEGVSHLVLGGVATNLVVESAARHASDLGFQVTVVEDMCASFAPELHAFSIEKVMPLFGDVCTSSEL